MSRRAVLLIPVIMVAVPGSARQSPREASLQSLFPLPAAGETWQLSDSLRVFRGDELFRLIDGGADVYLEYGFTQAGAQRYLTATGKEIQVEIYEMKDPEAAFGVFSFLASETGTDAPYGQEGVHGEGFLIFRKSRFVVSLTALDEGEEPLLKALGRTIDRRLSPAGEIPRLVRALKQSGFRNSGVALLKGPIAFEQRAQLGLGDLFRVTDGASGVFDGCRTFILRYRDSPACDSAEIHALRVLRQDGAYREVQREARGALLASPRGKFILTIRAGRNLLLTIGENRGKVQRSAGLLRRIPLGE